MEIKIEKTKTPKAKPVDETKLGFGHIFTDHMFVMEYDTGKGWHDARIVPYGDISISPAAMVLHYGQEIFEGMKAYRTPDGSIQFFRPEENFKRMNISAERLVIPQLNVDDCLQALHELVKIDADWVPHTDGASLYIRPFIFAADPFLGVRPGDKYYFTVQCHCSQPCQRVCSGRSDRPGQGLPDRRAERAARSGPRLRPAGPHSGRRRGRKLDARRPGRCS